MSTFNKSLIPAELSKSSRNPEKLLNEPNAVNYLGAVITA